MLHMKGVLYVDNISAYFFRFKRSGRIAMAQSLWKQYQGIVNVLISSNTF